MVFHHLLGDAFRVAILLGLTLLAMPLLRRGSSATRRLVLATSLAGALVLPFVSATAPSWHLQTPDAVAPLRAILTADPLVPATDRTSLPNESEAARAPSLRTKAARSLDGATLALCAWASGAAAVFARLLVGLARTRRIIRRATRAPAWSLVAALANRATGQRVDVRATHDLDAPAVAGALRPVILVPHASASWTDERRYAVLLHELAHVRQNDCLAQVVAQLACAMHWFNPLAWRVARRLREERELAADDAVVFSGARASTYAEDLLSIASAADAGASARSVPMGALGMAERSLLATRVMAIVTAGRLRRPLRPAGNALLVASVGAGVLAVACATPETVTAAKTGLSAANVAAPAQASGASTIDPRIEGIAEEELGHAMDQWKAAAGVVIVLDPRTGEVLANAGRAQGTVADVGIRRAYVTGSTLKAFTLAAALEAGVVSPTERIDCEQGQWTYQGAGIHDSHANGLLTVPELLAVSSNVGFAKIFDRIGGDRLERTLRAFHFGTAPAIEGAASGAFPEHIADHSAAGAMVAIGESMTASPLQVAAAYGAIANGGFYVAPTVTRRTGEAPRESVLKPETARTVTAMLEGVVTSAHATGTLAHVDGQRVAGKTGTAEWELPDGSKHSYSSFVGFVPMASPRFVILVGLEQAKGDDGDTAGGGEAAAPVFSRVATRALSR